MTAAAPQRTVIAACVSLLGAACTLPTWAQSKSADADAVTTTPTQINAVFETVKLPAGERMGWMGAHLMADALPGLRLGMGTYGATRGERGGFITIGAAAQGHYAITPNWRASTGLFVGGGGGRGGFTLSGGGLMVRADAGLTYETNGYGNYGVGISHVRFPNGSIKSTQPYVKFEYPFHTLIKPGWDFSEASSRSSGGIRSGEQEFAVVGRYYRIPAGVVQDNKVTPQHPRMALVGAEWLSYVNDNWFVKVEAEGEMGGKSTGYMQVFFGGGYRLPLGNMAAIKLHAAAGPAGGGAVDTGGGLLLDAGLGLQLRVTDSIALEASVGKVRAPSRSFSATSAGVKLVHSFGTPQVGSGSIKMSDLDGWDRSPMRLRLANQTYSQASSGWRSHHANERVGNIGLQLDYFATPHLYLTGQTHAAATGNAGAYMNGLVGAGARIPIVGGLYGGAEGLIGAAGGGGLTTDGLVGQAVASLGYQISPQVSLELVGGRMSSLRGPFRANIVGLQLGYSFTGFTSR